ncbi:hypothetical protein TNCV_352021 [Trichonephila clavipes]|nr:hypothetical protein TNCV_352021 [Trichonephila clavipes]
MERKRNVRPATTSRVVGVPQKLSGDEPNHTVVFMVLKATTNDWCTSRLLSDEFCGPRYDTVRQAVLATTKIINYQSSSC